MAAAVGRTLAALVAAALIGAAGCESTPTPLPVALSRTEAPTASSEVARLRIALSPDVAAVIESGNSFPDANEVEIQTIDPQTEDVSTYHLVIIFGSADGFTPAPEPLRVKVVLNTVFAPLNDSAIETLVRQAFAPDRIAASLGLSTTEKSTPESPLAFRGALANLGYPDGLSLDGMSVSAPFAERLTETLRPFGIDLRLSTGDDAGAEAALSAGAVDLVVVGSEASWLESLGTDKVIPLYQVPISYRASVDLALTFDQQGFPIPQFSQEAGK